MAGGKWDIARDAVECALTFLGTSVVPCAAWKIHSTAAACYRHAGDTQAAERHRALSEAAVMTMVDSLPPGDSLRASMLGAEPVRGILS
jgi:hypothetical protein